MPDFYPDTNRPKPLRERIAFRTKNCHSKPGRKRDGAPLFARDTVLVIEGLMD